MTFAKRLAAVCVLGGLLAGSASGAGSSLSVLQVTSAPKGKGALSRRHVNVVVASPHLSFRVAIRNGAGRRRLAVKVTVTRPRAPLGSLVISKAVWIGASRAGAVTLGSFMPILFAQRCSLTVSVRDVRTGETRTSSYPVVFSLG